MALTATIYNVDIDLADADRRVYESVSLCVARHPSESEEYMVTRILAYAREYCEGITFSRGLSQPDEPTIAVRDLTGAIQSWIEIGAPDAARLHKASKAAPRVVVYTHKNPAQLVKKLSGERIHRVDALEVYAIDQALIAALSARLERRLAFGLSITGGDLYISIGNDTLTGAIVRHHIN